MPARVRWRSDADAAWLADFFEREWGATTMVVNRREIDLTALPTLIAGDRDGVAVMRFGDPADLVLLHARVVGAGLGTDLLRAVEEAVRERGARSLRVTTTNDNLDALRFYQRRGFTLRELRRGAVEHARTMKPAIPQLGRDGIPIRDEIELERVLG